MENCLTKVQDLKSKVQYMFSEWPGHMKRFTEWRPRGTTTNRDRPPTRLFKMLHKKLALL